MPNQAEIKDAMKAKYNVNHRYIVHDVNGLPRFSATSKDVAYRRARIMKNIIGLDLQVCFKEGRNYQRIVWFRTDRRSTLQLNSNGTWQQRNRG
jgi:hypothetical protein